MLPGPSSATRRLITIGAPMPARKTSMSVGRADDETGLTVRTELSRSGAVTIETRKLRSSAPPVVALRIGIGRPAASSKLTATMAWALMSSTGLTCTAPGAAGTVTSALPVATGGGSENSPHPESSATSETTAAPAAAGRAKGMSDLCLQGEIRTDARIGKWLSGLPTYPARMQANRAGSLGENLSVFADQFRP